MEIYELSLDGGVKRIAALPASVKIVCAFGCFDGVHIGHRALLSEAVRIAEEKNSADGEGYVSAVWTFSEPVSKPWLIAIGERLSLCGRFGIKYALCQRFEDVRTLAPEDFIGGLVSRYGLVWGVCGENFRFGYKGSGDPRCLGESIRLSLGGKETDGGAVSVVPTVCELGGVVSSTRIRSLLSEGEVETVEKLLGRHYSLKGNVQAGKQIGRTISRPTANLVYSPDQLVPKRGVYFTYCRVGGALYRAVTNVGYRPTVNDDPNSVTCEAHLLDFSGSIYGECAEIIFVHYQREEIAFATVDDLAKQISTDVRCATEYFDKRQTER